MKRSFSLMFSLLLLLASSSFGQLGIEYQPKKLPEFWSGEFHVSTDFIKYGDYEYFTPALYFGARRDFGRKLRYGELAFVGGMYCRDFVGSRNNQLGFQAGWCNSIKLFQSSELIINLDWNFIMVEVNSAEEGLGAGLNLAVFGFHAWPKGSAFSIVFPRIVMEFD